MAYAEALLFIDDKQAEILELQLLRQDGMGADEDVDLALFCLLHDRGLFLRGAEAGEHLHLDGEVGEALFEALIMLEGEDCRGSEHGHLLAILHGFEGRTHGDLRLAIAYVSAEQAVHGLSRLHVALDVRDGGELVVGFREGEGVFELALQVVVRAERRALAAL